MMVCLVCALPTNLEAPVWRTRPTHFSLLLTRPCKNGKSILTDFSKAYYNLDRNAIIHILEHIGMPQTWTTLIAHLMQNTEAYLPSGIHFPLDTLLMKLHDSPAKPKVSAYADDICTIWKNLESGTLKKQGGLATPLLDMQWWNVAVPISGYRNPNWHNPLINPDLGDRNSE
ncbi:hypothetical protein Pelo_18065 [Pelomyxa schiedti]|nr:hypothetical protein Pelo_18065 [Pelomyxa schiedti]